MATHRQGTPPEAFGSVEGDDRSPEEAALHIEPERTPRSSDRRRRARRSAALARADDDRPARHYGFADEEPEIDEGARYDDDVYVFTEELAISEHYSFDDDPDDA